MRLAVPRSYNIDAGFLSQPIKARLSNALIPLVWASGTFSIAMVRSSLESGTYTIVNRKSFNAAHLTSDIEGDSLKARANDGRDYYKVRGFMHHNISTDVYIRLSPPGTPCSGP